MAITDYYVTVAGGATKTGTQIDPFDWATFSTRMKTGGAGAPGDRYNIQEGTYTLSATDTWTIDGSAVSPIIIQGCKTDWTVIEPTRATYNGQLITTNYPFINYNGNYSLAAAGSDYLLFKSLRVASAAGAATIRTGTACVIYGLSVSNSANNAASYAYYGGGGQSTCLSCDFSCTGTTAGQYAIYMSNGNVIGCRISDSAGYGLWFNTGGLALNNIFYGCDNYAISLSNSIASNSIIAINNTCYGGTGGITLGNVAYTNLSLLINNYCTDGSSYGLNNPNASGSPIVFANNRTRDNTSGAITWNGDWITATTWNHIISGGGSGPIIDYVNAPTDLNLTGTAAGIGQGIMGSDIGGAQKKEAPKIIGLAGGMNG